MTDQPNNNNDKRAVPIPDAPQMRSVLIRAASSFGAGTTAAARDPFLTPAAGALSVSAPPVLKQHAQLDSSSKMSPSSSVSYHHTTWTVTKEDLRRLPAMYPLERSHAHVENTVDVQQVADRISECLRTESIAAVFDEDKAMVIAETPEHVRFCIRLFLDKNDSIIVEIQRRTGCCFLFHQSSKAVLRAAQGMKPQPLPRFDIPDCVKQLEAESSGVSSSSLDTLMEDDLANAASLLKKDRFDAHLLGMESLVQLTNLTSSNCPVLAARAILMHDHVLDTVLSLIQSWRMHQEDDEAIHEMDEDYMAMMHRNALTVLSNCLEALDANNELQNSAIVTSSESTSKILTDDLLTTLIQELAAAEQRPHDACLAAKCLKTLVKTSDSTKQRIEALGACEALKMAVKEGVCSHCMLEQESKQLQMEIEN